MIKSLRVLSGSPWSGETRLPCSTGEGRIHGPFSGVRYALACREGTGRGLHEAYIQRISTRLVDDLVRRLALPVDRRDLREDARGRPHRERGGNSGWWRKHRRAARGTWPEDWRQGGGAVLDGVPSEPESTRPAGRQVGDPKWAMEALSLHRQCPATTFNTLAQRSG